MNKKEENIFISKILSKMRSKLNTREVKFNYNHNVVFSLYSYNLLLHTVSIIIILNFKIHLIVIVVFNKFKQLNKINFQDMQ